MKTLKQQSVTIIDINELSYNSKYDNSKWVTLEQVKDWLTQKLNHTEVLFEDGKLTNKEYFVICNNLKELLGDLEL